MELQTTPRQAGKKSEINRVRREGNIPAVLYSKGQKGVEIVIDGGVFRKFLNQMVPGTLSTCIFTLKIDGKAKRAIIKDIQYDVVTYNVIHIDFTELHDDVVVTLNIPLQCVGVVDCIGVKLGGSLQQILRQCKVRCLPRDIPSSFEIDVKNLDVNQSVRLRDISIPQTVRPLMDLKEIAVVVSKK